MTMDGRKDPWVETVRQEARHKTPGRPGRNQKQLAERFRQLAEPGRPVPLLRGENVPWGQNRCLSCGKRLPRPAASERWLRLRCPPCEALVAEVIDEWKDASGLEKPWWKTR